MRVWVPRGLREAPSEAHRGLLLHVRALAALGEQDRAGAGFARLKKAPLNVERGSWIRGSRR